jgi:hypothetical protein
MVAIPTKIIDSIFVEVFRVRQEALPPIQAYRVNTSAADATSLGRKLMYRFRLALGGHWVWADRLLLTDATVSVEEIDEELRKLWKVDSDTFNPVRWIDPETNWIPSAQALATFVAHGYNAELEDTIRAFLRSLQKSIKNGVIERNYEIKPYVVGGEPAISISVHSHVIPDMSLREYVRTVQNHGELIGLEVRAKSSNTSGEIVEILGTVDERREELLGRATKEKSKAAIAKAPADDLVFTIRAAGGKTYDYIMSDLQIIASNAQYKRLGIHGKEALKHLKLASDQRYNELVYPIAKYFMDFGLIESEPYNGSDFPQFFAGEYDKRLAISALLGDNTTCSCDPQAALQSLKMHPPYRRSIPEDSQLRIGILNLHGPHPMAQDFLGKLRDRLNQVHFPVEFLRSERPQGRQQYAIEKAIHQLLADEPHLILVILPGDDPQDGEQESLYVMIKSVLTPREIPSQALYVNTMTNATAVDNLALGIIAKTGNVPYVLARPFSYADMIVGIDIARERTERRRGSLSIAAMTRIYAANGDFLRYTINDVTTEGETLTRRAIRTLLPSERFAGKRVVLHRDGLLRGEEQRHLKEWGDEINAQFYPVEVIKSKVPRLYYGNMNTIRRARKGDVFVLGETIAFVVSSLPPFPGSTPRPLEIRTDGSLSIENAVHSVLALTHLHFGSMLMPRLPISLHYSDRIGALFLRGIRPRSLDGNIPFWI